MARSDTRYSIYPTPKAVEIIGDTAPALNQAVECWAALLMRSIADNSKTFVTSHGTYVANGVDVLDDLNDWGMLADALKDVHMDPDFPSPGALLGATVEDADRLHNLGWKWFHSEVLEGKWDKYVNLREKLIKELVEKVQKLDYSHGWALLLTVRWFWQHRPKDADLALNDHQRYCIDKEWWTLAGLRRWQEEPTKNPLRTHIEKNNSKRKPRKEKGS